MHRRNFIQYGAQCLVALAVSACSSSEGGGATPTKSTRPITPTPGPTPRPQSDSELAASIAQYMSLDARLGQMTIVEFYGSTYNNDLKEMIQNSLVSGVLIENKNGNAQTRAQLIALNQALQAHAQTPLFITTDYEGGEVNELRRITGERTSNAAIGATGNPQNAYNAGLNAAKDLTALGLNVNFMPIVDVLTNPKNPGLPQRTFGSNATLVTNMGRAYLKGLTDGNIAGSLKHFPGLGSANLDPHLSLPTMNRSLNTLNQIDFVPYRTLINEGVVPMVMVTHILNPQLDPKLPTSLSPRVVTDLLRNSLKFQGVIVSDTLWMGGISNTYNLAQAAVLAVKAGTDLLLGPRGLTETRNMIAGLKQAIDKGDITNEQITASVKRIIELKLKYKIISRQQALQLASGASKGEQ